MNTVINIPTLKRWVSDAVGYEASEKLMKLWKEFKDSKSNLSSTDLEEANVRFSTHLGDIGESDLSYLVGEWNTMLKKSSPFGSRSVKWIN